MRAAYDELCGVKKMLESCGCTERIYLDFSMVNDMNYYNDIVFRGFLNGVPDGILSGGRYDSLVRKMGKRADAIGFAVYLDFLERFGDEAPRYDADVLLVYDGDVDMTRVMDEAERIRGEGKSVRVQCTDDSGVRCRTCIRMTKNGAEEVKK